MAVTSLEVPFRADVVHRQRRWHWPRWALPLVIGLLIAGVLSGAAARITYAATYQPLAFDSGTYGPLSDGWRPVSDGFKTTRWLLTAKVGTTATFQYGIQNTGSDPVTIYDVPESPSDWLYTSWSWAPVDDYGAQGRALPVVVKPHQTIELLYSIRKPACTTGGFTSIEGLVVFSRSFGFSHTTVTPLIGNLEPIEVCWSQ